MRITYIFTTFPRLSERFLQREVEAMRDLGVELDLFSLWGGMDCFQGRPVRRFRWWQWLGLPVAFVREYGRTPRVFHDVVRQLRRGRAAGGVNRLETLLGVAFAVVWAPYFRRLEPPHIHAVWATAPATAALLLQGLTGARFSMGAHAYDVFRDGGDWLLETKLRAARLIHTSTEATQTELLRRGAAAARVVMIRRGLEGFPALNPIRPIPSGTPIRLLSVGRLIEKKGFDSLIRIGGALQSAGVPFVCRIIGAGPLQRELEALSRSLRLEDCLQFIGAQPYEAVVESYQWADLFCFTGRIAASQDRDGLPNVIAEAMAHGVPVLTAPVSGTVEAVQHGISGYVLDPEQPELWVSAIDALRRDEGRRAALQGEGRRWVESNFDARRNAQQLLKAYARAFE
jgi:colanic acid/amylovoran biosynthesis glycosyltransferase